MQARINQVTETIIGAAIAVHRELGPGLLESTYEKCLLYELHEHGCSVECQKGAQHQRVAPPVIYKGVHIDAGYRVDLLVDGIVIVEVKAVEQLTAVDQAQLLSYLKLSGCPAGLLINFHSRLLKHGIRRFLNGVDLDRQASQTNAAAR